MNRKIFAAEFVGTVILMLGGPGSAILAGEAIGTLGIALAFGFSLLIAAYCVGPTSGCHINPAVTLAMWVASKVKGSQVPAYVLGQLAGAVVGGSLIYGIAAGVPGYSSKDSFAANAWGTKQGFYPFKSMVLAEVIFTALLVFVVLSTTSRKFTTVQGGLVAGLTLALIHLISIPVDNTSVNPARSIGAAVFARGDALEQLWAFIVFPLVGAFVGVLTWVAVDEAKLEDTVLA